MNNVFNINADPDSFDSPTEQFIWARAKERHYKAIIAEAEAKVKTGELIAVAEVRRQADQAGRSTRDAVLSLPDRVASMLVGRSEREIVTELRRECRGLLNRVANEFEPPETGRS